jgi:predicted dehydrogenase
VVAELPAKPLMVDFDAARRIIERIDRDGRRAAINSSLAASAGLQALPQAFDAGSIGLGGLQQFEIEPAFATWPRPWQAPAGAWLSQRAEGGFVREVLSYFIFVLQRVLGPAAVQSSTVGYPCDGMGAETALQAHLQVAGVPVHIHDRIDASLPQAGHNRMRWQGRAGAVELREWFASSRRRAGEDWVVVGDAAVMRAAGQAEPLEQWVVLIAGRAHGLPDYAEALAVQQTIEAVLAGR